MEKIVETKKIRSIPKRLMQRFPRGIYLWFVSLSLFTLLLVNLPQKVKTILEKNFVLEQIKWEEVGSTNLSYHITKSLLWNKSGLKLNESIWGVDLGAVEAHLLEIPWIESVQLQKKLPSTLLVRYTTYHARALGFKEGKLWLIASDGKWVVPIGSLNEQEVDLPVLTNSQGLERGLFWLDTLEKELSPYLLQVYEINDKNERIQALVELQYPHESSKVWINAWPQLRDNTLHHLGGVLQYLIKNKILISSIDLRDDEKVIVNVGKRL